MLIDFTHKIHEDLRLLQRTSGEEAVPEEGKTRVLDFCLDLDESQLKRLWRDWLEDHGAWHLHMLIPQILVRRTSPSIELCYFVLKTGIEYPCLSYNRPFIQAALRFLGQANCVQYCYTYLHDRALNVKGALYWTEYVDEELCGSKPDTIDFRQHRKLKSRLIRLADLILRERWWRPWWKPLRWFDPKGRL